MEATCEYKDTLAAFTEMDRVTRQSSNYFAPTENYFAPTEDQFRALFPHLGEEQLGSFRRRTLSGVGRYYVASPSHTIADVVQVMEVLNLWGEKLVCHHGVYRRAANPWPFLFFDEALSYSHPSWPKRVTLDDNFDSLQYNLVNPHARSPQGTCVPLVRTAVLLNRKWQDIVQDWRAPLSIQVSTAVIGVSISNWIVCEFLASASAIRPPFWACSVCSGVFHEGKCGGCNTKAVLPLLIGREDRYVDPGPLPFALVSELVGWYGVPIDFTAREVALRREAEGFEHRVVYHYNSAKGGFE